MPGLFDEFALKGLNLKNRVMMSPMCQYHAEPNGMANDWHFLHYGSRAVGGVGLVMVEATGVESRGRITSADLGIWSDDHVAGLARIVDLCRPYGAKTAIQLAHAGTKSEVADEPNVAPSSLTRFEQYRTPHALTESEIADIVEAFRKGAERAVAAGFDTVEIHGAHGYLINQFLSPITNRRDDSYGGSLENRLRFPLEVIRAVKAVIPEDMPLLMRVSSVEYSEDGYSLEEMVEMARQFKEAGVDMIDCSSGGNVPVRPDVYPGYQVPFAATIRRDVGLPTVAVGRLDHHSLAEEVVRSGRADLVAIGTGLLKDPYLAKHMAEQMGIKLEMPGVYGKFF